MDGSRLARMARRARVIGAAAVVGGQVACYTLQAMPGGTSPVLGHPVAVDITDAGRVALGGSMGPEIQQIEGRLLRDDTDAYELAVTTVRLLRGGEQGWAGERVRVLKAHVARVYEKRLSKGRTVAASVGGAAILAFFVTRTIEGAGLGDEGKLPPDTAQTRRRPVRP